MSAAHAVSLFGAPIANGMASPQSWPLPPIPNGTGAVSPAGSGVEGAATGHAPFADLLTEAVGDVGRLEAQARSAVEGLMSGTGVDVHTAMIATEKAEMGFELALAVRNKALAAYQQVMGMQF